MLETGVTSVKEVIVTVHGFQKSTSRSCAFGKNNRNSSVIEKGKGNQKRGEGDARQSTRCYVEAGRGTIITYQEAVAKIML